MINPMPTTEEDTSLLCDFCQSTSMYFWCFHALYTLGTLILLYRTKIVLLLKQRNLCTKSANKYTTLTLYSERSFG